MFSRIRRTLLTLPAIGLALAVGACGDDDNPMAPSAMDPQPAEPVADVSLRVAHLSPDAPPVDVLIDGEVVLSGVSFPQVSDYLALPAGEYRVQVTPAGANEVVVIDATVGLESGGAYTVAATGFLADITPLVIGDRATATTGGGASVRFIHTGPDAPAVDIAVAGGDVIFSDVTFRESTGYAQVPAGTYDLEVRLAGTATVALSVPGVSVSAGMNYTIYAIGLVSDGSLAALPLSDAF